MAQGLADFLETLGSGSAHHAVEIEKNRATALRQKIEQAQGFRIGPLSHQQALSLHKTFLDLGQKLINKEITPKDYELSLHEAMQRALTNTQITDWSSVAGLKPNE